jgi:hypothetical protein
VQSIMPVKLSNLEVLEWNGRLGPITAREAVSFA